MHPHLANCIFSLLFLVSTAAAAPSSGCGKDLPAAQQPAGGASHTVQFNQSDGTARTYLIHIPSNYDKNTAVPLYFSFHGNGGTSSGQETISQFSNEEFNPNGIAVYPQGLDNSWEGAPYAVHAVNDTGFVQDMIAHFNERYCIETSQYYASGKSNGGGFCGTMACDPNLSTQIAAFASVSGAFYTSGSSENNCQPTSIPLSCGAARSPVPIIQFHGSADDTIPYAGGGRNGECLPSIPHWVREWSQRDGFGLTNVTTSLYDGKLMEYQYSNGSSLGTVTHYLTKGLGHNWPSTIPGIDGNPEGTFFNATPIILDFFKQHILS